MSRGLRLALAVFVLSAPAGCWLTAPFDFADGGLPSVDGSDGTMGTGSSGGSSGGSGGSSGGADAAVAFSPLKVSGNKLVNQQGQTVVLHGVDRSGTEYACIQGSGIFSGPGGPGTKSTNDDSQAPLIASWGANAVHFGINEDCWLNINTTGLNAAYLGQNYVTALKHETQTLEAHHLYPVVSLFWAGPGTTMATGQSPMPDSDHAPAFWQSVANTFKDDPYVVFRLTEETDPGDGGDTAAIWSCWQNGDVQYDTSNSLAPVSRSKYCMETYTTVGMQSLINIIRGTGATNIIQVPGIQQGNTMDQFLTYAPTDPLNNIMAVVDVYPEQSLCGSTTCYDSQYAPVIAKMPFMAGDMGPGMKSTTCSTSENDTLMQWFDQHGAGYGAWDWDNWGACNQLISDYTTATPQAPWGVDYKAHLGTL